MLKIIEYLHASRAIGIGERATAVNLGWAIRHLQKGYVSAYLGGPEDFKKIFMIDDFITKIR